MIDDHHYIGLMYFPWQKNKPWAVMDNDPERHENYKSNWYPKKCFNTLEEASLEMVQWNCMVEFYHLRSRGFDVE